MKRKWVPCDTKAINDRGNRNGPQRPTSIGRESAGKDSGSKQLQDCSSLQVHKIISQLTTLCLCRRLCAWGLRGQGDCDKGLHKAFSLALQTHS